jgi:hypothetical protein
MNKLNYQGEPIDQKKLHEVIYSASSGFDNLNTAIRWFEANKKDVRHELPSAIASLRVAFEHPIATILIDLLGTSQAKPIPINTAREQLAEFSDAINYVQNIARDLEQELEENSKRQLTRGDNAAAHRALLKVLSALRHLREVADYLLSVYGTDQVDLPPVPEKQTSFLKKIFK